MAALDARRTGRDGDTLGEVPMNGNGPRSRNRHSWKPHKGLPRMFTGSSLISSSP